MGREERRRRRRGERRFVCITSWVLYPSARRRVRSEIGVPSIHSIVMTLFVVVSQKIAGTCTPPPPGRCSKSEATSSEFRASQTKSVSWYRTSQTLSQVQYIGRSNIFSKEKTSSRKHAKSHGSWTAISGFWTFLTEERRVRQWCYQAACPGESCDTCLDSCQGKKKINGRGAQRHFVTTETFDQPLELTLTATTDPSLSFALCTCAIEADATGFLSNSSKTSSGEETPKSAATMPETTE